MNIAEIKSLKEDIYRVEMDDKLRSRIDDALVFFREKMEREENEDSIVDLVSAIIETRIQKEEKNGCEGK